MWKVVSLLLAFFISIPFANFAFAAVSAKSDMGVAIGLAMLLTIGCIWFRILRSVVNYFKDDTVLKYKTWRGLVVLLACALFSTACGRTVVEPGHVGIKVDYYGQDRGVESYPQVTGMVWYNPFTTSVFQFPTFVQTASWTKNPNEGHPANEEITFTTADQMVVSADISLAYSLVPEKVPAFYVKFRTANIDHFTHGFLRNLAREKFDTVAGKYRIEQIMGDNAPFLQETRGLLQAELTPIGVELSQFGFIGAPRPPQQVTDSINAKVQATQIAIQIENEVRQSKAQSEKKVAVAEGNARAAKAEAQGEADSQVARAKGEAEANRALAQSISQQLIEWRRLQIQENAIQKWQGGVPQFMGSQMPIPFLNIEKDK